MVSKISNPWYHISYWVIVLLTLIFVFGRSWGNDLAAFFFVAMLFPVVLGTSYFFNYYLVPFYLLKKKYFWFVLYSVYTLIISLYLETLVLLFSFVYFAKFSISNLGPNANSTLLLALVMYLLVFFGSFMVMIGQIKENQQTISRLISEQRKINLSFLEVTSNRKLVRIPFDEITYIESLADYIKIHTYKNEIISKEKISNLNERLPQIFIRIHRSFIVNKNKVTAVRYNELEIEDQIFTIGRSYQKKVKDRFGG